MNCMVLCLGFALSSLKIISSIVINRACLNRAFSAEKLGLFVRQALVLQFITIATLLEYPGVLFRAAKQCCPNELNVTMLFLFLHIVIIISPITFTAGQKPLLDSSKSPCPAPTYCKHHYMRKREFLHDAAQHVCVLPG